MKYIIALLLLVTFATPSFAGDKVMERVIASGKLRCGYVPNNFPAVMKDETTGDVSGYMVDIMKEAALRMGLELVWAQETNWGTFVTDMKTGKFDTFCASLWVNPKMSQHVLPTAPIFYQPIFLYTRADDTRFDKDISKVNDKNVKFVMLEGDVITRHIFPEATAIELPQLTDFTQIFQEVMTKKADVTLASYPYFVQFEKTNPGKLKVITDQPVRIFSSSIQVPPEAYQLQTAVSVTIQEMQLDGTIPAILKKYAVSPYDYELVEISRKPLGK